MHLVFFSFLFLGLKVFLLSAQIFVDLRTDERTEMKKTFVCDLTLWRMFIKMIKPDEVIFILLFSFLCHSSFYFQLALSLTLLSRDASSIVSTICSSKVFSDVKFSLAFNVWLLIFNVFLFSPNLLLVFFFSLNLILWAAGIVSFISSCSCKYCQSTHLCFTPEEKLVDKNMLFLKKRISFSLLQRTDSSFA